MNSLPLPSGELVTNNDPQNPSSAADKITLLEERLKIDLHKVETGSVQVHKKVISESVSQQVPVVSEEILIEHKPVSRYVETYPAPRTKGDTTIISVVKEVLVVEKRLLLVEEIHFTKTRTTVTTTVSETLRREVAEVNHLDSSQESMAQASNNH
ncbi:MAG: DUF2382 domain-containing protein [Sphingobacteriaceae bacterium]|nr:MAG: DUF2382 domain-containing protein [Sphingobacteriaceae bacterium]